MLDRVSLKLVGVPFTNFAEAVQKHGDFKRSVYQINDDRYLWEKIMTPLIDMGAFGPGAERSVLNKDETRYGGVVTKKLPPLQKGKKPRLRINPKLPR
jgi:hypothetical protein